MNRIITIGDSELYLEKGDKFTFKSASNGNLGNILITDVRQYADYCIVSYQHSDIVGTYDICFRTSTIVRFQETINSIELAASSTDETEYIPIRCFFEKAETIYLIKKLLRSRRKYIV